VIPRDVLPVHEGCRVESKRWKASRNIETSNQSICPPNLIQLRIFDLDARPGSAASSPMRRVICDSPNHVPCLLSSSSPPLPSSCCRATTEYVVLWSPLNAVPPCFFLFHLGLWGATSAEREGDVCWDKPARGAQKAPANYRRPVISVHDPPLPPTRTPRAGAFAGRCW
jgi:hypothetical protein